MQPIMQDVFALRESRAEAVLRGMWARQERERAMTFTAQQVGANIVAKIASHIGEHEVPLGSNRGPRVDIYNTWAGNPPGPDTPACDLEWCAACSTWMVHETLEEMSLTSPYAQTDSSHEVVNFGVDHDTIQRTGDALPGDYAVCRGGSGTQAADGRSYYHTTILEYINGDTAHLMEPNKFDSICRNTRPVAGLTFVRGYVAGMNGNGVAAVELPSRQA